MLLFCQLCGLVAKTVKMGGNTQRLSHVTDRISSGKRMFFLL